MTTWIYGWLAILAVSCGAIASAGAGLAVAKLTASAHKGLRFAWATGLLIFSWLLLTGFLAWTGFLSMWDARPPHFQFVPLAALVTVALIHRNEFFAQMMAAIPRHWVVGFQTYRVGVELAFWGIYVAGLAPVQVTFEGRNFDVLVGLTAPIVALAIVKFDLSPRAVIAWNIAGLAILGNTIFTTITSLPGPAHLDWPGDPFVAFGSWPFVWIPGFLAPMAIFLHITSIRQNFALLRSIQRSD